MAKIKFICEAVRWFDRMNGNTYHSVRITRARDGAVIVAPFQYGYGDAYKQTALELMAREKWLPPKYRGNTSHGISESYAYERENGYPIKWTMSDGLKRDCIANGKL